jgi:two-component system, sporulation sensor kinase E
MLVLRPRRRENFIARILAKGEKLSREMIENLLREVAEERDLLEVILDSMAEAVMAASDDGTGILVNKAACQLLGLRQDDILGNNVLEVLPRGELLDLTRQCLKERTRILWQEVKVATPVERVLLLTIIPIQDSSERHKGIVMLFFDVTERKMTEEGLKQAQKLAAMTTLSAQVSHELRNPLNNLHIYTQLAERELRKIRDGDPASQEHAEAASRQLKVVRDEIQRLNDVLEEFLIAVRPTKPVFEEVDVYSLVEGILRLMDPELQKRNIRVNLNLNTDRIAPILADESQLRLAIRNLLQNAAEAIGEEGEITVGIDSRPRSITISVADTGPGIPPDFRDHIFEPYFSTKTKGTGLGLVIARRVIEDHGGRISVQSKTGRGAEFMLTIPRRRERSRLIPHHPPQRKTPSAQGEELAEAADEDEIAYSRQSPDRTDP